MIKLLGLALGGIGLAFRLNPLPVIVAAALLSGLLAG